MKLLPQLPRALRNRLRVPHWDDGTAARQVTRHEPQNPEASEDQTEVFQAVLESLSEGVMIIDRKGSLIYLNSSALRFLGRDSASQLIGRDVIAQASEWSTVRVKDGSEYQASDLPIIRALRGEVVPHEDMRIRRKSKSFEAWLEVSARPLKDPAGHIMGAVGTLRDISQVKHQDLLLRDMYSQQAAIANLGQRAFAGLSSEALIQAVVDAVASELHVDCADILELDSSGLTLTAKACSGNCSFLNGLSLPAEATTHAGQALISQEPVVVADQRNESRFTSSKFLAKAGIVSSVSLVIQGVHRPFGVLNAHSRVPRVFSRDEMNFIQSLANLLAIGIRRQTGEAALHSLHRELEQRVQERTAELARANEALKAEIGSRKQTEQELTKAKEAAEAANRAKSAFIANISHEIRTPLGAILGFAEMLLDPSQPSEEVRKGLSTIRRNGAQLLQLVDDILDLSKVEAGRLEVERLPSPLGTILNEVSQTFERQAAEKGLSFSLETVGKLPSHINTDPLRLRQILTNIVGNAIKFTSRGYVRVRVSLADNGPQKGDCSNEPLLHMTVEDSGPGLSSAQQLRLFQPFVQADSSTTRKFGGTGLGLALSRRLARALGGDVMLDQSESGRGSTFRITIGTGSLSGVPLSSTLPGLAPTARAAGELNRPQPAESLRGVNVLLVEDGPDNQVLLSHFLRSAGAKVTLADDGLDGVEKAEAGDFDVVLMDIQMPRLDGYAATHRLREAGYTKPIIALTAHAMKGERERCLRAGCDAYLTKPIDRGTLIDRVAASAAREAKHQDSCPAVPRDLADRSTNDVVPEETRPSLLPPLRSHLEHDQAMHPIITTFVSGLPTRLAALRQALCRDDFETFAQLAHQIKGAAGGFGFPDLGAVASILETKANAHSSSGEVGAALDAFARLCQRARAPESLDPQT